MSSVSQVSVSACRILIVDDEPPNVALLEGVLKLNGYSDYRSITDSRAVLQNCTDFPPDLILLDLHMPHPDGFAVMESLRAIREAQGYLPILVLTVDIAPEVKRKALALGANDFLSKPFDLAEVTLRVQNLLFTRALYQHILTDKQTLEVKVRERTEELVEAQRELLERLALVAEYRDDDTGRHAQRVGQLAGLLARAIGKSEREIELLRLAATLHDIGKIGVPDRIFLKPSGLTGPEFEIMKSHATIGANILKKSRFSVLQLAREIAQCHHERWDGCGYPQGLRGDLIPLSARIVAIADAFDAITHDRPYRKARSLASAVAEMKSQHGRQFDPTLLSDFLAMIGNEDLESLYQGVNNAGENWFEWSISETQPSVTG